MVIVCPPAVGPELGDMDSMHRVVEVVQSPGVACEGGSRVHMPSRVRHGMAIAGAIWRVSLWALCFLISLLMSMTSMLESFCFLRSVSRASMWDELVGRASPLCLRWRRVRRMVAVDKATKRNKKDTIKEIGICLLNTSTFSPNIVQPYVLFAIALL